MGGVTILNTYTEYVYSAGWTWEALIPIIIFGALAMLYIVVMIIEADVSYFPELLFCVAFGTLCVSIIYIEAVKTPYLKYEVIIDEKISFQEFNKKYEVLEQRGQIYVIKEREENK